jgi:hypothetical protein
MMKTLQEMALARSEFGNPAGAGRPVTALSGDPALVPEKGIDEPQVHSTTDGPGIRGIHRIEQLGNKESLIHWGFRATRVRGR